MTQRFDAGVRWGEWLVRSRVIGTIFKALLWPWLAFRRKGQRNLLEQFRADHPENDRFAYFLCAHREHFETFFGGQSPLARYRDNIVESTWDEVLDEARASYDTFGVLLWQRWQIVKGEGDLPSLFVFEVSPTCPAQGFRLSNTARDEDLLSRNLPELASWLEMAKRRADLMAKV